MALGRGGLIFFTLLIQSSSVRKNLRKSLIMWPFTDIGFVSVTQVDDEGFILFRLGNSAFLTIRVIKSHWRFSPYTFLLRRLQSTDSKFTFFRV
jgi:hypothetical protein